MGRPKKVKTTEVATTNVGNGDAFVESLIKEFGPVVFNAEKHAANLKRMVIPYSPANDMMFGGGIKEGSSIVVNGKEKSGKMQDVDSLIFTPNGPIRLGNVNVGLDVCNASGETSKILEIYPHGYKDIYEIEFNNGDKVRCGLEHLWEVYNSLTKKTEVVDLQELINRNNNNKSYFSKQCRIKLPKPLMFLPRIVKIPPYILGCLIGNGGIKTNIRLTNNCDQLVDKCNTLLEKDFKFTLLKDTRDTKEYVLTTSRQKNIYKDYLRFYNLFGKGSYEKFIPEDYMYNTIENRMELIRGLMDTDGTISNEGKHATYSTVSYQLAKDFKRLLESIGAICTIKLKKGKYKGKQHLSWKCSIRYKDLPSLFYISNKKDITQQRKKPLNRTIKNVNFLGKKECLCIKLDNPDGLYITDNCVVTHNTVSTLDFAATAQDIKYADEELFPNGRRVFFFSVENRLQERDIDGIQHLDRSRFDWIQSSPGHILTADKVLNMAERALHQIPGCIVVIDSFSALCSAEEMSSGYDEQIRPKVPMMLAKFCKRLPNILPVNKNILVGITHRMANQGGGPSKWSEGGGTKIQYAADFKMKTHWSEDWMVDETKIGKIIHWDCETTALDRPIVTKAVSRFRFGYGIDKEGELIDIGQSLGLVEKAGAWYSIPSHDLKAQGFEKMREAIVSTPGVYEDLNKQFRTMMGFDKYDKE